MNSKSFEKLWQAVSIISLFLIVDVALARADFTGSADAFSGSELGGIINQSFESLFQENVGPIVIEPALDSTTDSSVFAVGEQDNSIVPLPVKKSVTLQKASNVPVATRGTECPAKHDRPTWSRRNGANHMDEDCCADYDEWPKPGCAYSVNDFMLMLRGPTSGHKKHK